MKAQDISKKPIIKILDFIAYWISRIGYLFGYCYQGKVGHLRKLWVQSLWKARLRSMGESTELYPNVVIHSPNHVSIGANVAIAEFVHIWGSGGVNIGNDVLIASHVVITSQTHDPDENLHRSTMIKKSVIIGDNVWIGAGSVILPGITIGRGSVIGAGSVVTSNIPENQLAVGVPARLVRNLKCESINT